MKIRPLIQEDAAFLCSIFANNDAYYEIFFDSCSSLQEWNNRVTRFLNQDAVKHFIVANEDKPFGWFSYFDPDSSTRELCILVIDKAHLRCGYGTHSLMWLMEKSRTENMQSLLLHVNQDNTRAIRFYQKLGFEIVGEEIIPQCNEAVNLAQYQMKLSLV